MRKFTEKTLARVIIESGNTTIVDLKGKDVTSDVKSQAIEKAKEHGETFMFFDDKGIWKREGYLKSEEREAALQLINESKVEQQKPEPVMENPVMSFLKTANEKKPQDLVISDLKWKYLVRSVLRSKNVMMTGDAGCGKTFTAQKVAEGLERPFFYFNLGATQDPRTTLIGNTQFKEGDGTYFNASLFVKAIQTDNAVILLDEISRAHPEAWNILMTVLDEGQRYLRLDEQEGAPTIKVGKGVSFIATANIGAAFTSTRVMDRALMDRFTIIEVDPMSIEAETDLLLNSVPGLSNEAATAIAEIADGTRRELRTDVPKISTAISTRSTLDMAGLLGDGFTLAEAAEVAILPFFSKEGGVDSERTFVKQLIQRYDLDAATDDEEDLFNIEDDTI